jgi:hypothetical protein
MPNLAASLIFHIHFNLEAFFENLQMIFVLGQIGVTAQLAVDLDLKLGRKLFPKIIGLTSETWKSLNAKEENRLKK